MGRKTYIDGNSIGHAANTSKGARKEKLYAGGKETTAIFGMLRSMQVIMRERSASTPVILWDGRSWRFERFAEYKGNRTDSPEKLAERESYKSQRPAMFKAMHLLGIRQLIASNMEADDLAGIVTRRALSQGHRVALITGDKDWIQLVEPGVTWVDHKSKPERKVTSTEFHQFTGFRTQKAFIHGKALMGDTGDNVKPNTGIGEKGAVDLLAVFSDVHAFLAMSLDEAQDRYFLHHGKKMPNKCINLHQDKQIQDRFEWALSLMDLNHPSIPAPVGLRATHTPLNRPEFEKFCAEHAFMSILNDMDRFLAPFITNEKELTS